jgi:selenocysteine lyase/cysteine desulfurase
VNIVARSLPLEPNDGVLTTIHEYGAIERAWTFVSEHKQTRVVVQQLQKRAW